MCSKSAPATKPAPAPQAPAASTGGSNQTERKVLSTQNGTVGNVFTSVLGDANYGQNVQGSAQARPLGL